MYHGPHLSSSASLSPRPRLVMSRLALLTPGRSALVAPPMQPQQYATCAGIANKDPLPPDPVPLQKRRRGDAMNGGGDDGKGQKKRRRVMTASGEGAAVAAAAAAGGGAGGGGVTAPVPPPPLPPCWPRTSETALRIDAIRLVHRCSRSGRIRPPFNRSARTATPDPSHSQSHSQSQNQSQQGPPQTPALCRITVAARDGGRVLHCDGLRCTIETGRDPYGGAHALSRIRLDDPYSVDWATLTGFEHACRPPGLREEDAGKQFLVTIEVEASAQSTAWPPLAPRDLVGSGSGSGSSSSGVDGTAVSKGDTCGDGFCPHVLVDEHKGPTTTAAPPFTCPYWRLESVFTGFARPLSAPLFLKHFSGKGDLVHRTDYETRVMGGTA